MQYISQEIISHNHDVSSWVETLIALNIFRFEFPPLTSKQGDN